MQGDYFTYNNQVYPGYTPYTCAPYTQNVMPPTCHRTIESLKQKSKNKSMSASRHFDDHSTDESIHLIRSRRSRGIIHLQLTVNFYPVYLNKPPALR